MRGKAAEYVYAELQVVESCDSPGNAEMDGSHVVAVRLGLGGDCPSGVLIFTMAHALQLRDDINRILREHAELTSDE